MQSFAQAYLEKVKNKTVSILEIQRALPLLKEEKVD